MTSQIPGRFGSCLQQERARRVPIFVTVRRVCFYLRGDPLFSARHRDIQCKSRSGKFRLTLNELRWVRRRSMMRIIPILAKATTVRLAQQLRAAPPNQRSPRGLNFKYFIQIERDRRPSLHGECFTSAKLLIFKERSPWHPFCCTGAVGQ